MDVTGKNCLLRLAPRRCLIYVNYFQRNGNAWGAAIPKDSRPPLCTYCASTLRVELLPFAVRLLPIRVFLLHHLDREIHPGQNLEEGRLHAGHVGTPQERFP